MASLFITGTDTGVGKTMAAAGLLALAREKGVDAAPMKPVQTGCTRTPDGLSAPDLEFCLDRAEMTPEPADRAAMLPYAFEPACSPHLAAEQAGIIIEITRIVQAFENMEARHEVLFVEGAGGLLTPLSRRETMLDLMRALKLPVLLVARPGLGTINHSLLSVRALRAAGLEIAGILPVETENTPHGFIEKDNPRIIAELGGARVFDPLPFHPDPRDGTLQGEAFREFVRPVLAPVLDTLGLV